MKNKIILAFGAALFVGGLCLSQAHGEGKEQIAYNKAVARACESAQELGYNIMILRQTPVTEEEQIQTIREVGLKKKTEELGINMVKEAHKRKVVEPVLIESTAIIFGYDMKEKCLKDMSGRIL